MSLFCFQKNGIRIIKKTLIRSVHRCSNQLRSVWLTLHVQLAVKKLEFSSYAQEPFHRDHHWKYSCSYKHEVHCSLSLNPPFISGDCVLLVPIRPFQFLVNEYNHFLLITVPFPFPYIFDEGSPILKINLWDPACQQLQQLHSVVQLTN